MIKVFGALASPAGAAPGGEAGACGKALLILMAPFVWAQMGLGVRLGAHCSDLAGRPEHLERGHMGWMGTKQRCSLTSPSAQEDPAVPESSPGSPALSDSLPLVGWAQSGPAQPSPVRRP